MFDIGWTEMLVIAVVMIVIVGPKDLPKMLRTFGKMTSKMRSMAGDFQKQFNEALKEAELDDVKKSVDSLRGLNPTNEIKKHLNPFEKAAADVRAGIQSAMKPTMPAAAPDPSPAVHAAEPLKNGATAMPGVAGPEAMPSPPPELAPLMQSPEPAKATAAPTPMADPAPKAMNGSKPAAAPRKSAKPAAAPSSAPKPAAVKSKAAVAKPKAAAAAAVPAKATKAKAPAKKSTGKPT